MKMRIIALILAAAGLLTPALAPALTIDCREYADPTLREGALLAAAAPGAVAMSGDLACLIDDGQLLVVDAADADAPQVLGVWTPPPGDTIEAVAMGSDYAVVLVAATLLPIDLRNPAAPVPVLPAWVPGGPVGRLAAAGDRICAQVGEAGLLVLAQADGQPLTLVGFLSLPGAIGGLAMGPQHAYVTQGLFSLTTVAITASPVVVDDAECYESYGLTMAAGRLIVDRHGSAYDGDNQPYSWSQADVFDLTDPAAPALVTSLSLPGDPLGMAGTATGALLWLDGDLLALDPAAAHFAGALSRPQTVSAVAAGADVAVAATPAGFRFYDAATPINVGPQQMFFEVGAHPWQYAAGGRWLVAGRGYWGGFSGWIRWNATLRATDLITGEEHDVISIVSTMESPVPVPVLVSDELVVIDGGFLLVMDVTTAGNPADAGVLAYPGPRVAAIAGHHVLVASETQLTAWNCSDPTNPTTVGQWPLDELPRAITTAHGWWQNVVLAYDDGRLEVRDLTGLMPTATYQLPQPANALAVHHRHVVCGTDAGLLAVEAFAIPELDKNLGDILDLGPTEAPVVDLAMDVAYLYAGLGAHGTRVYWFTGTAALPLAIGGPAATRLYLATAADDQLALIASRDGLAAAIGVLCNATATEDPVPAALRLAGAAPNPFNPRTTIHFTLDRDQDASLVLFDARGRLVRNLLQGSAREGHHAVMWDGCDDTGRACAAGVYLARLTGETATATTKLTLVR